MYKLLSSIILILVFSMFTPKSLHATVRVSEENQKTLGIAFAKQSYSLSFVETHSHLELIILTSIYSGLLTSNPATLQPEVGLALSWFVNDTKDTFIFNLRRDAMFSDGSPVRAQDVRDSWLASIKFNNAFIYLFELIEGVSEYMDGTGSIDDIQIAVVNDKVLKVMLKEPAPYFLSTVTHPAFLVSSSEQVKKEDWGVNPTEIVFSGPFVISSYSEDVLELEKNETFWDKDSILIEKIQMNFYDYQSQSNIIEDINSGEIHWSTFYHNPEEGEVEFQNEEWVIVHPIFGSEYLFFGDTLQEPWNKPQVRKALTLLMPLEEIKKDFRFAADNLVPSISGIYESNYTFENQNVDLALEILEEEGYPKGKGMPPIVFLATRFSDGTYRPFFDLIVDEINAHLVDSPAEIKTVSSDEYQHELRQGNFDVGLIQWIGDFADPSAFLQIWSSPNPSLGHNYNNKDYQTIISRSNLEDDQQRRQTLIEAETMLLDSAVVIPLRRLITVNVVRTDLIRGWSSNILDLHLIGAMSLQTSYLIPRLSYANID